MPNCHNHPCHFISSPTPVIRSIFLAFPCLQSIITILWPYGETSLEMEFSWELCFPIRLNPASCIVKSIAMHLPICCFDAPPWPCYVTGCCCWTIEQYPGLTSPLLGIPSHIYVSGYCSYILFFKIILKKLKQFWLFFCQRNLLKAGQNFAFMYGMQRPARKYYAKMTRQNVGNYPKYHQKIITQGQNTAGWHSPASRGWAGEESGKGPSFLQNFDPHYSFNVTSCSSDANLMP